MAKIELTDLFTFEVSLDELLRITRELLKHTKRKEVRDTIKTMFREIRKADKALVKGVLVPLFSIETQAEFDKEFSRIRKRFKKAVLEGRGFLYRINCGLVINKLETLQKSQVWKKSVPLLKRSLSRLEITASGWIFNDHKLHFADVRLIDEINRFLDSVQKQKASQPKLAFAEFQAGLKEVEDEFMQVKKQLADLKVLSDEL